MTVTEAALSRAKFRPSTPVLECNKEQSRHQVLIATQAMLLLRLGSMGEA